MAIAQLRQRIRSISHADEHLSITRIRQSNSLPQATRDRIVQTARNLTKLCRNDSKGGGALDAFLLEFGLSNKEGVALMCLAEALLRVPDSLTCDRLIAEKIKSGHWKDHNGHSNSLFVNASTWGLMLTGKIVHLDDSITDQPSHWLSKLLSQTGEPVVRMAMLQAMRIMGNQYVLGRNIDEAMKRGRHLNQPTTRFSFDMLGEGARTYPAAEKYFTAYSEAIDAIGKHENSNTVYDANGISVKLSALHPRYHFSHQKAVMHELLPKIKALCLKAKQYNIGLSIDAEEVDRLDLSLDIFERLATDPQLQDWQGLGFVLQAYQKRAADVADWLIELAKETDRRIMVRLVKGAYWDAEIKHAQEQGLSDYPVYTRKVNTDLSYQHCSKKLLDAQHAIYPQFATHNAYTVAMVVELAGNREFEFQRLHGMGELLYRHLQTDDAGKNIPVRVYAPVGNHKDLLPYLVRRLLENGANSSFVNRFLDRETPVEQLINDVESQVAETTPHRHQHIPTPNSIYHKEGRGRNNAKGLDISSPIDTEVLLKTIEQIKPVALCAHPIIADQFNYGESISVKNPATNKIIGHVTKPTPENMTNALNIAADYYPSWDQRGGIERARLLDNVADTFETHFNQLIAYICLEAGRTLDDGVSEVREAIDFCRYYANQARNYCSSPNFRRGQGVFLCISPWNFPLAIFTGQVAAALAAGNTVIAKPALQTAVVAFKAIELFHRAGIPAQALQFLPGSGSQIGEQLIKDPRLTGICFTGSTETAQHINKELAKRTGPTATLIAETGGQNAMVVDSSALPEQVVDDVISSAFLSAGQRCSALRVLFLQDEIADKIIEMLQGAMQTLNLGDPSKLSTDIGPVIDPAAKQMLTDHIDSMKNAAKFIASVTVPEDIDDGNYFAPQAIEISSLAQLPNEIFGPVLHIIRYKAKHLPDVIQQINDTGFGLTLGIHSRIEMVADYIYRNTKVGNTYINRNMVGAVVGVNPFGGQGLSGTGPKAGGPNYLLRFTQRASATDYPSERYINSGEAHQRTALSFDNDQAIKNAVSGFSDWRKVTVFDRAGYLKNACSLLTSKYNNHSVLSTGAAHCQYLAKLADQYLAEPTVLPGPTGEENSLSLHGRGVAICLASEHDSTQHICAQILMALISGCVPIVVTPFTKDKRSDLQTFVSTLRQADLPQNVLQWITTSTTDDLLVDSRVDVVVINERDTEQVFNVRNILAQRDGAIIPLIEIPEELKQCNSLDGYALLSRFVNEKTKTDNIVARGGDTKLFNLA
jgi:RHH-type transcriptional regulator, proline utilization regulon repressor / proline dehydrogenase / delta 1-pyrroline-5-carboxylate dehydrogenase